MITPQIRALNTVIKTAEAATSFIISITGLISLQLISASFSIAVLKSSAAKTKQILITIISHANIVILKIKASAIVKVAHKISILKFRSLTTA